VTKLAVGSVAFLMCALATGASQHRSNMPVPPETMDADSTKTAPPEATLPRHIDLLELQREADDLARTAQTIPSDVANVRRGTLPKNIILKLKQIEKLPKQLRSGLSP